MIETISNKDIVEVNRKYSSGTLLRKGLDAIYSSFYYYETDKEKICSIFHNLIKGHFFTDGNKRTSVIILLSLARMNGVIVSKSEEELFDITIKIAESNLSVEEISRMIF